MTIRLLKALAWLLVRGRGGPEYAISSAKFVFIFIYGFAFPIFVVLAFEGPFSDPFSSWTAFCVILLIGAMFGYLGFFSEGQRLINQAEFGLLRKQTPRVELTHMPPHNGAGESTKTRVKRLLVPLSILTAAVLITYEAGYFDLPFATMKSDGVGEHAVSCKKPDNAPAGQAEDKFTTLLSTSFEECADDLMAPFNADGKVIWKRDARARTGRYAMNVIPDGNPGRSFFLLRTPTNRALLSSQLSGDYKPFNVSSFRRLDIQFWRLSTSNPSMRHNCLGSLHVSYRFDGGSWQSKMVYCGVFAMGAGEWKHSRLEFDTTGRHEMEIRFEYENPPVTWRDKAAVYLIDDLVVRAH